LRLTLVALPEGEVKNANLLETSGYPYVDQKAIELAKKIIFDPLPSDWKQVEQQGVLSIKLKL
jgi:TonB family protein